MNWAIVREPTIVISAAVYGLLAAIALAGGVFGLVGLWLGILVFISIWRYSYAVLRAVAQGQPQVPPPDIESFNPVGEWAVFWHFISFPGLVAAVSLWQPALGVPVAVLAAIVFPASAAVMALSSSLSHAFNPVALIGFARTVGSDYGAMVVGIVVVAAAALLMVFFLVPLFGFFSSLFGLMIEIWALFAVFALIGSVLRAHRLDFEIPGERKPREEFMRELQHREWHKVLDIAYASFRSGLTPAGYKTLHELVEANGDSLEVNHWLVENMLDWADKRYALEVAAKLMPRLLAGGDNAGALELYHRCRRRDPNFRLPEVQAEKLAAYAASVGQTGIVAELGYNRELL